MTALYVLVPPFKGSAPLMNLLGLSGLVAVVAGIRRNRPQAKGGVVVASLFGLFLYWIGDVYTYSYGILFERARCRSRRSATRSTWRCIRC